jgi:fructokinase
LANNISANLYIHSPQVPAVVATRVLVLGEVLWDRFPDSARLGGAPLNFAVQLKRFGEAPLLVSAVGVDQLGEQAGEAIAALGLDTTLLQSTDRFKTGCATVHIGPGENTSFTIERPAAYDALDLADDEVEQIVRWDPVWFYYGTLFASCPQPRRALHRLLHALPNAGRFYDLNLRPGFESPELVSELLRAADVVKLNERELRFVHECFDLPGDPEGFCRAAASRYQWRAACITLGARGCAMLLGDDYLEEPGFQVNVADPVGAGDAFAAAFLHGISANWSVDRVARFSNRAGALVAAAHGAIPE